MRTNRSLAVVRRSRRIVSEYGVQRGGVRRPVAARLLRARAHSSLSEHTLGAYSSDVRLFAEWVERGPASTRPTTSRRTLVRRYIAYLSTREFARRSIARKAASIRRYFVWAVAEGLRRADPTIGLHVAGGSGRLPRVLDGRELGQLLDGAGARRRADLAQATRRRRARDPVRLGRPRVRAVLARARADRSRRAGARRVGQGREGASRPARRTGRGRRLAAWLAIRHDVVPFRRGPDRVRQRARQAGSRHATCGGSSTAARRRPPIRTPCGTRSPPICSTAAPICGRSRNCSVTPTWQPPSVTLTSAASG